LTKPNFGILPRGVAGSNESVDEPVYCSSELHAATKRRTLGFLDGVVVLK
jgi:hypothetical protein